MRRFNIFAALSVLMAFFLFSCGSDENNPTPTPPKPDEVKTTSIKVEVEGNKTEIKKGETLSFVVKNQEGTVLKEDVTIFVDGKKIDGTSYTFKKAKFFYIYAKHKTFKSPKLKVTVTLTPITIEIKEGKNEIELGETLSFIVKDDKNNELKENVTVYVDKMKIDGFSYTFEEIKEFSVYAKYDGAKSQELTINVTAPPTTHTAKVLLEDYTGAWCGYCPRVAALIEELKKEYPKTIIPIALHGGKDPFKFSEIGTLMDAFGIQGFPSLMVDRTFNSEDAEKITGNFKKFANLGLAISSTLTGENLKVKVKVHSDYKTKGNIKLVVFLLESGLLADQANYYNNNPNSPYYKKGNPIKDFEHNHVARVALTNVLGDKIPDDKNAKGATYEWNKEITLPSSIQDKSKLTLVAFVVNGAKKAINAQEAKVGEDKDFD